MKIIVENITNNVVMAFDDSVTVRITEVGVIGAIQVPSFKNTTHTMIAVVDNHDYVSGCWKYESNEWVLYNPARLEAWKLERDKANVVIPESVTMRQARLALLSKGLLSQVATAISTLQSPQKEVAEIEWEFSSVVVRNKEFVILLGTTLGLSAEQLDELFIYAATL